MAAAAGSPGGSVADLGDQLHFHRRVQRQLRHADRAASMPAFLAEHLHQQLAPFTPSGWPLNPGALATKPVTLTIRRIRSSPPAAAAAAAIAFSAQVRASPAASAALTSAPTLPVAASFPSTTGTCPETYTYAPVRTAGT